MSTKALLQARTTAVAFVLGAAISGLIVWAIVPKTITVVEARPEHNWKPPFCATFLSKDDLPLAVCSDRFFPAYDVQKGYLGLLKDCVVLGKIRGCKEAKSL